jgi:hypothetical protein
VKLQARVARMFRSSGTVQNESVHPAATPVLSRDTGGHTVSTRCRALLVVPALIALLSLLFVGSASATTGHTLAGAFGGPGLGNGLFNPRPSGIGVFGVSGDVYVADGVAPFALRVQRFDSSGGFVSSFALEDAPVPSYTKVSALAVDSSGSGSVYVIGRESAVEQSDVLKFSADGTFEYVLDPAGSGTTFNVDSGEALAVDPVDGTVYVSASEGTEGIGGPPVIDRFDGSTGAFIESFNGSGSPEGAFLCRPTSLAVDSSQHVYVLEPCRGPYGVGEVDQFAADGTFGATVDDGSRGAPKAVAVGPVSGDAYVAQIATEQPGQVFGLQTPHVTQYAAGGAVTSTFDLGSTFGIAGEGQGVVGMAVNDGGTVYLADSSTAQVARFTEFDGPTVVTGASSEEGTHQATVEGTVDPEGVPTTYHFEYGVSSYGAHTAELGPVTGSVAVPVSAELTGLEANKTYHYRLVGSDASGSIDGADGTFTTPQAPVAVDSPEFASAIGPRSARAHGAVNPNNTGLIGFLGDSEYHFDYGTNAAYGSTAVGSDGGVMCDAFGVPAFCGGDYISVAAPLSGLLPDTTYHFRVVGDNGFGSPQAGPDQTFITAPAAAGGATSVTSTGATLTGTINPHGVPTSYHFNYGPTAAYGASTADVNAGDGDGDQRVSLPVTGLLPDTTYHVQVVAESEDGVTRYGADGLFRTASEPSSVAIAPAGVSSGSATLAGELNTFGLPGTFHFDVSSLDGTYRASTAERPAAGSAGAERVSVPIEGLPPGKTFQVRLVVNSNGSTTFSDPVTFATPALPPVFLIAPAGASSKASVPERKIGFSITKISTKGSTATLSATVPGPGRLDTSGGQITATKTRVDKAGSVSVKVDLSRAGRKALKKSQSRSQKVKVTVRFTPAGGKPVSKTLSVTFTGKAGR